MKLKTNINEDTTLKLLLAWKLMHKFVDAKKKRGIEEGRKSKVRELIWQHKFTLVTVK